MNKNVYGDGVGSADIGGDEVSGQDAGVYNKFDKKSIGKKLKKLLAIPAFLLIIPAGFLGLALIDSVVNNDTPDKAYQDNVWESVVNKKLGPDECFYKHPKKEQEVVFKRRDNAFKKAWNALVRFNLSKKAWGPDTKVIGRVPLINVGDGDVIDKNLQLNMSDAMSVMGCAWKEVQAGDSYKEVEEMGGDLSFSKVDSSKRFEF